MKLAELLKLTATGYKPADIKEVNALGDDALKLALNGTPLGEVKELLSLVTSEEEGKPSEGAGAEPREGDGEPDYKSMYEALKTETDELKNTIKEIQLENQKRNNDDPNKKSLDDELIDIVSSFM